MSLSWSFEFSLSDLSNLSWDEIDGRDGDEDVDGSESGVSGHARPTLGINTGLLDVARESYKEKVADIFRLT